MQKLCDDLSVLTCIESKDINKLVTMSNSIISHYIEEAIRNKDMTLVIDIGLGTLSISNIEGKIHYKFIPSETFESTVSDTYNTGKSRLKLNIEKALGSRLTNTYKDLF